MIYEDAKAWAAAPNKRVCLFGMSGLGKTHTANMLRASGAWFHYSIDYRIGTRYLGEAIADNAKAHAMQVPFLRELLLTDSIYIGSNITFDNLAPLSTFLGKPGDPSKGGIPIDTYRERQALHDEGERAALLDTPHFMERALSLYGYPHFVCDTGGSICEVVDPDDPKDPILKTLSEHMLMVWIEGTEEHRAELVRRFNANPKPMCYRRAFLDECWSLYLSETGATPETVDPDDFIRFAFARAVDRRHPIYRGMARWGVTVQAAEVAEVRTPEDFDSLIARALDRRA